MKASADDAPPGRRREKDWDETVLVWNGTVARVQTSGIQPNSAEEVADVEGGSATPIAEPEVERQVERPGDSRAFAEVADMSGRSWDRVNLTGSSQSLA